MRAAAALLRSEPRARTFYAVLLQSSLGTGAGYVALLLIAYSRFESAWAISLVLAAELLPAMFLGPLFGAIADRFSRRACMVTADLLRAAGFFGIVVVDDFTATVAFAAVAGIGTGLFTPAALASLPSLVERRRLPAATALFGAINDLGFTLGPAVAAALLLLGGASEILAINGVTFVVSSLVLARLSFGSVTPRDEPSRGRLAPALLRDAANGLRAAAALPGLRTVLIATSIALFFGGAFNVAELPFAREELGAGGTAFSMLVAVLGAGFIAGSLTGSGGGALPHLKRRYLSGLAIMGLGILGTGFAPGLAVGLLTFAATGYGNGLALTYERLIIQEVVPDNLAGRIFGVKDALTAWAFAAAFTAAGGLIELLGVRAMLIAAGAGGIVAWAMVVVLLRFAWQDAPEGAVSRGLQSHADAGRRTRRILRQDGADLVSGGGDHWLALLDDLDEGTDDSGIELGPGVTK